MTPSPISSTPVLRTTLVWGAGAAVVLGIVGAIVGSLVGGVPGLWSALLAVLLGLVFLSLTAISILVANRWYGGPLYVPIFFGMVMGAWVLKFVAFLIVLFVLRDQPWLDRPVFLVALIVSIVVALVIDVVVMLRMRIPHASDVSLPTADDIDEPGADQAKKLP